MPGAGADAGIMRRWPWPCVEEVNPLCQCLRRFPGSPCFAVITIGDRIRWLGSAPVRWFAGFAGPAVRRYAGSTVGWLDEPLFLLGWRLDRMPVRRVAGSTHRRFCWLDMTVRCLDSSLVRHFAGSPFR